MTKWILRLVVGERMNRIPISLLFALPLIVVCACSHSTQGRTRPHNNAVANIAPGAIANDTSADSPIYPYNLGIGGAVDHVELEPEPQRVRLEFLRWSDGPEGGQDALFRVTNPDQRPILVWNIRRQVSVTNPAGTGRTWQTRNSDYPGRGWEQASIPAGGSVQFPMFSASEGDWRVCLLYSRELPDSQAPNRRFGGTYEVIGPSVREKPLTEF